jgi:hypothetical protein
MTSPPQLSLVETRIQRPDYAGQKECITVGVGGLPGIIGDPA